MTDLLNEWVHSFTMNPQEIVAPMVHLSTEQKRELKEWVENIEVEIDRLPSSRFIENPYCLDYPYYVGSGEWDYDEEEKESAQRDQAIDLLEHDGGVWSYFGWGDDDDEVSEQLTKEAIQFIKGGMR